MVADEAFQADAVKVLGGKNDAIVGKDAHAALKQFFGLPEEVVKLYR